MQTTIGRIVLYTLTEQDAEQINRRRTTGEDIASRIKLQQGTDRLRWPVGAQAHIGNEVHAGDVFPMMITRVWTSWLVNGQVLLDGNDVWWVSRAQRGCERGTWAWSERD